MPHSRRTLLAQAGAFIAAASLQPSRLSAVAGRPAIAPPPPWFLNRLPGLLEVSGTPGCAAVVLQKGRVAWEHYAGVQTAGQDTPVTRDTMWPAASLGKPVFAAAVLALVADDALELDTPLRSYLPDHASNDERTKAITARHVLSHTSGLPNWRNTSQPLVSDFQPGSRFSYSGEGFYYLQAAVESITGVGIQQVMRRAVFDPLRMASATYAWRDDVPRRLATGHSRGVPRANSAADLSAKLLAHASAIGRALETFTHDDVRQALSTIPGAPPALPNFMVPNVAGSLVTTPGDYATFVAAILNPSGTGLTLRAGLRSEMTKPQVALNSRMAWGLGWGLETNPGGQPTLWHWGDNGNWKNFVLAEPAEESAVIVFTNSANGMNVAERLVAACTGADHVAFQWL